MKLAYHAWAPPHSLRVVELPADFSDWFLKSRAVCQHPFRELLKIDWGVAELDDFHPGKRPFGEFEKIDLYPDEVFEAAPGLWILSARNTVRPAMVARDARELCELWEQEDELQGRFYIRFEIPEALALAIIAWDDSAERDEGDEIASIRREAAAIRWPNGAQVIDRLLDLGALPQSTTPGPPVTARLIPVSSAGSDRRAQPARPSGADTRGPAEGQAG